MKKYLTGLALLLTMVFIMVPAETQAYCEASVIGPNIYGQSGASVKELQQCLIDAGYSIPAGTTGYFGEQTRSAVRAFYAAQLGMPEWDGNSVGPVGRSKLSALVTSGGSLSTSISVGGYKTLVNAEELKKYLTTERVYMNMRGVSSVSTLEAAEDTSLGTPLSSVGRAESATTPDRVSETNVQISGVDEPDIVKTDGQHIFVSGDSNWYGWARPMMIESDEFSSDTVELPYYKPEPTKVVDAYPVDDLAVVSEAIEERGEMLFVKDENILIIFSQPKLVAYDVTEPKQPKKKWEKELDNNSSIVTSRLLDGSVYLVTQTYFNQDVPCPVVPLRSGGVSLSIPCGRILVSDRVEPVSHLYAVLKIDPIDGSVTSETAVAGDYGGVTVMMSNENLYLASPAQATQQELMMELVIEVAEAYVPASVIAKARTIMGYDISSGGKQSEITLLFETYFNTLSDDEDLRIQNEIENVLVDKLQSRQRDLYRSRIVRIGLDTLKVEATGDIPGHLLNQFAMDEYEGHLRVAVTVGEAWGDVKSVNDVYVLSASDLKVTGKVTDLGLSERIYSVRFMGDKGYLVTFRQTDPFYVLDLSIPTTPKMVGELKIPGYSAYLEYLGDDLVLGVGRENNGVKLSVFDVSDPTKPVEKSKYQLKDYWSEVDSNHHAFLRDDKHKIFFIPGGEGGYIFSYSGGELSLKKALSGYNVKRALYIDDNLYIVSEDKIRVLDETSWKEIAELDL